MTDGSTFVQAFIILFREGLEALLVIAALVAFLRRANAAERIAPVYMGALAAIVASIVMAWVFATFYDGNHSDLFEAVVMLAAAVLLFYMSGWMFVRQDPKAWQADLNRLAERALGAGTMLSLAGIAFLAVFREGAETILFVHTLAKTANGFDAALLGGLATATLALVAMFVAMQWLALRLPLRPMFVVTSAFLFFMGLRMVGQAFQELQEQALIPFTTDGVPAFVSEWGLSNGSWEALGTQLAILAVAAAAALVSLRRKGGGGNEAREGRPVSAAS
ncbi:FTR1 family protein [Methylobacterium sp. J-043]|uniref:FTR1 family iron permease n=1 Tax=Methylorubrum TaxID=2282523 RepID=UPI0020A1D479|nr:FTR1 family protein [Methylobacterium sp. J-043]MCP1547867.1 high-affinity iron transporter [Methylorubrum zatmanii]MCP1555518.1 high-affinity iron transporter [Methylorubrum extorquens]MCP1578170.1 high-affinity iron transporter [Methylorubrum extorquens]